MKQQFRNLVFEGGGVKGIAYAGAVTALEKRGIIREISRTAGTSAGAITACLVGLGATGEQIREIVGGTKFRKFMDDSWGIVRDTKRLLGEYGWYAGDAFSGWIQKQIYALTGSPNLTFEDLAALSRKSPEKFKELFVVGTNLSSGIPIIFSAETTPEEKVWRAVRVSMSIPLFFASVRIDPLRQVMVDGGVSWNYPLDLFDDIKYVEDPAAAGNADYPTTYDTSQIFNKETLGLRVDTKDEIKAEKESWRIPPVEINDFFDYAKCLVGFMIDMANRSHLHSNDWHRTIFIDADGVKTTEFDISEEKVYRLVENGGSAVKDYFTWWDHNENALNKIQPFRV